MIARDRAVFVAIEAASPLVGDERILFVEGLDAALRARCLTMSEAARVEWIHARARELCYPPVAVDTIALIVACPAAAIDMLNESHPSGSTMASTTPRRQEANAKTQEQTDEANSRP